MGENSKKDSNSFQALAIEEQKMGKGKESNQSLEYLAQGSDLGTGKWEEIPNRHRKE